MIYGFSDLNYYEILDIAPGKDAKEIQEGYYRVRSAFAKNALASYSLYSAEEREKIQRLVEEAYHTLIDEKSREEYERKLAEERNRLFKEGKVPPPALPFLGGEDEAEAVEPRAAESETDESAGLESGEPREEVLREEMAGKEKTPRITGEIEAEPELEGPPEPGPREEEAGEDRTAALEESRPAVPTSGPKEERPEPPRVASPPVPEKPRPPVPPVPGRPGPRWTPPAVAATPARPPVTGLPLRSHALPGAARPPTIPVTTPRPPFSSGPSSRVPVPERGRTAPDQARTSAVPARPAPVPAATAAPDSPVRGREEFEDTVLNIPPPSRPAHSPLDYLETSVSGAFLKKAREDRGVSLDQVFEATRIRKPILVAIEEENFKKLPADVFLKGMILILSRFLELPNPETVVKGYLDRLVAARDWLE